MWIQWNYRRRAGNASFSFSKFGRCKSVRVFNFVGCCIYVAFITLYAIWGISSLWFSLMHWINAKTMLSVFFSMGKDFYSTYYTVLLCSPDIFALELFIGVTEPRSPVTEFVRAIHTMRLLNGRLTTSTFNSIVTRLGHVLHNREIHDGCQDTIETMKNEWVRRWS